MSDEEARIVGKAQALINTNQAVYGGFNESRQYHARRSFMRREMYMQFLKEAITDYESNEEMLHPDLIGWWYGRMTDPYLDSRRT